MCGARDPVTAHDRYGHWHAIRSVLLCTPALGVSSCRTRRAPRQWQSSKHGPNWRPFSLGPSSLLCLRLAHPPNTSLSLHPFVRKAGSPPGRVPVPMRDIKDRPKGGRPSLLPKKKGTSLPRAVTKPEHDHGHAAQSSKCAARAIAIVRACIARCSSVRAFESEELRRPRSRRRGRCVFIARARPLPKAS